MMKIVICSLMQKKSLHLKPTIKMLTFQFNFISNEFSASDYIEVCLNGSVYDFEMIIKLLKTQHFKRPPIFNY